MAAGQDILCTQLMTEETEKMAIEDGRQKWGRTADRQGDRRHKDMTGPTDASFISAIVFFMSSEAVG